ncbi:T9SS type A sorting domain-containing protein [Phnomibacter ginsenosidimutans]|uniref:T9SS type A sorting domain-containing protein n=1 Tax=Phnomibacter ginsenosidimutans TaxID=2676868 RepID=A0A6I6GMV3_9BACT|nr:T9SS type A sorting domain-containing protein [Phnomibacter ginsenosidimutans]QGW29865.1 T9SS type A sorting domain-containing protein [Phnomibacter ginsenosidimutans]
MFTQSWLNTWKGIGQLNPGKKYSQYWLLLAIGLIGQVVSFAQLSTGDDFNRGLEDNALTGYTFTGVAAGATVNNTSLRTGIRGLQTSNGSTSGSYIRHTGWTTSVPAGQYVHVLAWGRSASGTTGRKRAGVTLGGIDYAASTDFNITTTWQRFTFARQNSGILALTANPFVRAYTSSTSSITQYHDDMVMYVSNSPTTDVVKPVAPSCLNVVRTASDAIQIRWSNGSDAATGVQGTLVLRINSTSGTPTALNDQGTYTTSSTAADGVRTIGSWTIIANLAPGEEEYVDNTVASGQNYRYTIAHYDLALNYSAYATPVNANASAPAATLVPRISQSISNLTRPTGGTFQPGDSVEIKVTVDYASSTPIYNLKARIYIDPKFTYKNNSMRVKDNKGFDFSDPTAPGASPCGTAFTGASGNISGLTDAGGDDMGNYNSVGGYADIMLGEKPTATSFASLEAGTNERWGGRVIGSGAGTTIPSYYNGRSIVVASIAVIIPSTATIGDVYDISSTTFYSYSELATASQMLSYNINSSENSELFTQIVVSDPTLPASYSSRGANLFSAFDNGTFGGGTNIDGPGSLTSSALTKTTIATGAPGDGFYSISKNTAGNQAQTSNAIAINHADRVFTHWYVGGDHTGTSDATGNLAVATADSGGYMLIVNADYVPTRVVEQTITGLCPGTFYNFKAWFKNVCPSCGVNSLNGQNIRNTNPADTDPRRQGVKPSLTFDVNNQAYYTTGPIDTSDGWIQKQFVFATGASSGDFNFSIRNNSPGGDGNDWAIDDISIITRGPSASVNVDADPVIDPEPSAFCIGQRFQIMGNWIESTGAFTQYDAYQFQWAYGSNGPWNAVTPVMELPTPNDPYNPTNGRIDSAVTESFNDPNREVYFRVVVATQASNISLADAAPCQVTAYNSAVIQIGSCVLPIKLLRFKAASFGQQVLLNWATADIDRLQYFVIERSTNGVDFSPVEKVNPNSFVSKYQYQLTDLPQSNADRLWYRLKMVHLNNEITYSAIEMVGWKKTAISLNIQPNPAKDMIQLNWSGVKQNQKVKLSISNATGNVIHTETITIQNGPTQQLRLPAHMAAGLYFVQVEDNANGFKQSIKLNKL